MAERKTSKVINVFPDDHADTALRGQPTGTITFTFSDDTSETFDVSQVPDAIRARLALHGAAQKIGDSYAGAAATDDPLAYAKSAVQETIAQLYKGDWRVSGGGGGPRVNELALAISRAGGETLEECVEFVGAMSDDEKKAWRKKPKVALALAQIAAEKQAKRIEELQKAAKEADEKEAAEKAAQPA
jgi:hypothetical protein